MRSFVRHASLLRTAPLLALAAALACADQTAPDAAAFATTKATRPHAGTGNLDIGLAPGGLAFDPQYRPPRTEDTAGKQVVGPLTGFSRYAIAY